MLSSHFGQFGQLTSCLRRTIGNTAPFSQLMRANKPVWQMTEHLPSLPTPEPCRHGNKSSKRVNNLLLHTLIPGGDVDSINQHASTRIILLCLCGAPSGGGRSMQVSVVIIRMAVSVRMMISAISICAPVHSAVDSRDAHRREGPPNSSLGGVNGQPQLLRW